MLYLCETLYVRFLFQYYFHSFVSCIQFMPWAISIFYFFFLIFTSTLIFLRGVPAPNKHWKHAREQINIEHFRMCSLLHFTDDLTVIDWPLHSLDGCPEERPSIAQFTVVYHTHNVFWMTFSFTLQMTQPWFAEGFL